MSSSEQPHIDHGERPAPLAGLRVLDFTMIMAGPYCARLLADAGADVIKVEAPGGERGRGHSTAHDLRTAYWASLNCGKRSIVLDLKNPEGAALARRLAATVDVVLENFRPGVMKRLGLGYEALSAENPRLVYCCISGFGQIGPNASKPAYAPVIHAASGLDMAQMRYQNNAARPANTGTFMADILGGMNALAGVQSALLQRARTGRGQMVDVALLDSVLSMLVFECQEAQFPPTGQRRHVYTPVRAEDGFVIVAPITQKNFENLARTLGKPQWLRDDRFATSVQREENWDLLMSFVEEWTQSRSGLECEEQLMAAGVPCSRYLTVREALKDPQLAARGTLAAIGGSMGEFQVINPAFRMSGSRVEARDLVSQPGQHTDEVLREILRCDGSEVERLRAAGALG